MMRLNLVLAAAVAAGVVGCAQCDTCDDFPMPCNGPNCGQNFAPPVHVAPMMDYAAPSATTTAPAGQPGLAPAMDEDSAGPAPAVPSPTTPPPSMPAETPAPADVPVPADVPAPTSPPLPMEPAPVPAPMS